MASSLTTRVPLQFGRRGSAPAQRSQVERLWLIGGGLACVLVLLLGAVVLVNPEHSTTLSTRQQVAGARSQLTTLQDRINALRTQSKDIGKYEAQLSAAQAALPAGTGGPTLIRSLQAIGASTGCSVSNTSYGTPVPVTTAATTTGTTGTTGTTAATTTAAPAATPSGVYSMAVTTAVSGSAAGLNSFLEQLQQVQPRALLITQLTTSTGATSVKDGAVTMSLSMLAFMTAVPATTGGTATSSP